MTTPGTQSGSATVLSEEETYIDDAINLSIYWKALSKYRWSIILTTALLTGIAALIAFTAAPTYRATATLLIETQQAIPMNLDNIIGIDTNNKTYYQTQFEVLRSKSLARRVVTEMDLYNHPELTNPDDRDTHNNTAISDDTIERQKVIERFIERTRITPVKNTKMVAISFDAEDPAFAARIANKIADTYILSYLDSRSEMGQKATTRINERLAELKTRLAESQSHLLSYRESNGLVNIQGDSARLREQEIGIITGKLLDAQSEAAYARVLNEEVNRTKKQGTAALLSLPSIDSNDTIQRYKLELRETEFLLNELRNRYGDKHPKVVEAVSRQDTARGNLNSQLDSTVDSIQKNYLLARQTVDSLTAMLEESKSQIQQSDRTSVELLQLEREVSLNQELFDTFYNRSREVYEAQSMESTNSQVAEFAETPLEPVSPKKILITLLTLILSLGLTSLIAILRDSTDKTITSTEDVELKLGARMLGIMPLASKRTLRKSGSNVLIPGTVDNDSHAFEESVHTIRTSICLDDLQQTNKTIMVTSALPSEGKSTLASHLAYSLSGIENVLLIECDLRRPSLHRAFNFTNQHGLTKLLAGEARFADCINLNAIGNLDVIPAGSIPEKPLDLLSSRRFSRLIELMSQRYDRIIIDSAPVQAVSDALLLGQFADSVLYSVKANSTPIDVAARGVRRMHDAGIKVTGVVVSQVNLKKESYGGELNYQGYYDFYGYSDRDMHSNLKASEKSSNEDRVA